MPRSQQDSSPGRRHIALGAAIGGSSALFLCLLTGIMELLSVRAPAWLHFSLCASALGGAAVVLASGGRRLCIAPMVVLVFATTVVRAYPNSTRKSFLTDLNRIERGMGRSEVDRIMAGYIVGTGWSAPTSGGVVILPSGTRVDVRATDAGALEFRDAVVYRHDEHGAFNADWGVVTFRDDRVVDIEFSPD